MPERFNMPTSIAPETHHARITEDLRQQILSGQWLPGRLLAKETELAAAYGVSRMTMNKALSQLAREGFLIRRRRSGTFVAQKRVQSAVMEINDIEQEVEALGLGYEWKLFHAQTRVLKKSEAQLLDLQGEDGRELLLVSGLHLARGEPFCLETRVIDQRLVPDALAKDFTKIIPGQWLKNTMPFSAAQHRIRAINSSGQDARRLALPVGTACLEVLRKTRMEQSWVTHVRLLYPGEAHQLVADFTPV